MSKPHQANHTPHISHETRPRHNTTGHIGHHHQNHHSMQNHTTHQPAAQDGWTMNHSPWTALQPQSPYHYHHNNHNSHQAHHQESKHHHHSHKPDENTTVHKSRLLAMDDRDIIIVKLKLQTDRLETRIEKLEAALDTVDKEIEEDINNLKKEAAFFKLSKKKELKGAIKLGRAMRLTIEQQIWALEHGADDDSFLQVVKDSNQLLAKLNEEIDLEAIADAKILQKEGQMRREEIEELLQSEADVDQELKNEIDEIEISIFKVSQALFSLVPKKELNKEESIEKQMNGNSNIENSKPKEELQIEEPKESSQVEQKKLESAQPEPSKEDSSQPLIQEPGKAKPGENKEDLVKRSFVERITSKVTSELCAQ